jgi:hypothetical protein
MLTPDHFNRRASANLPGHLGIVITRVGDGEVRA